jgi:hypothetical protein
VDTEGDLIVGDRQQLSEDHFTLYASRLYNVGYMDVEPWQRKVAKDAFIMSCYGKAFVNEHTH